MQVIFSAHPPPGPWFFSTFTDFWVWGNLDLPHYFSIYLIVRSDRVPKELQMEVHDIVQEAVIKTIPKKEMQKGKMVSYKPLINS